MKRLARVSTSDKPFTLILKWEDGAEQVADLSGLISLSRHFAVFADDPDAFARVRVINWGHGLEWENGLDYSTENLSRIADEQAEEDGRALIEDFQNCFKLTNEQVGLALGYKVSQIKNFKAGVSPVNPAVRIAIHTMKQEPTVLYARMRRDSETGHFQKPVPKTIAGS
ncbi:DUF2442 domain-containing protein [Thalassospira sp.]|uniref:DUF2442 domain-containing protein n=1 Tax=Thalassospira sp. TaxID=1912094 RepID=UPI002736D77F|nr:DUF2442 domain-containing protein [Thalassospira sp.]MDP2698653.1 DUF2442 domain-containing protein [Thalassospira sp.]